MFSDHIIEFYNQLEPNWNLPKGVSLIYPFNKKEVIDLFIEFCNTFYNNSKKKRFLFGINPGRFGAGMTGIPFTDPFALSNYCNINNSVIGQRELSSIFIYSVIEKYGGAKNFYKDFYITSICPLGFIKNKINYNYYDDKELLQKVEPYIVEAINYQTSKYCNFDKAFSLGKGKNYKYFLKINEKHKWFKEIIPLPHPRWIMQYKRKDQAFYLQEYISNLNQT